MKDNEQIQLDAIDLSLLKTLPLSFTKGNLALPVRKENGKLIGLAANAQGVFALKEIAEKDGLSFEPIKMEETALLELINRAYGMVGSAEEVMGNIVGEDLESVATEFESPKDILELTEDAPIIRLLNALLQQAVKENASDIHIEPYEKDMLVRLRVDGMLKKALTPPKLIQDALISRIKIMSNLDISEKRLPQDGRIRLLIGGKDIDIRVSIIPSVYGERAVLRLLDRKKGLISLSSVGMLQDEELIFKQLLNNPHGIILVTGPTGSGKTTTLYAALNTIHTEDKNIITVEDPVEYQIKGIGQININTKIGLTFASGLRSILRHDPDVIMVGEIRDLETAEIAIQASLTGHLVLSTLHTNDAPSAITRLIDMGIEPFLLASSLSCVVAQRLLRNICPYCRKPYQPLAIEAEYFNPPPPALYRGSGCHYCNHTGYMGRTAIFELLQVNSHITQLINRGINAQVIKEEAIKNGMRPLRSSGLHKAATGITTLAEVMRVTQTDYASI
ncbi:MAG: type II secretion system ATPase GspE [Candidatus Magnetoovum sp. WYHC-5]|nr:type II secretion system ATPase GspE [Candidatus Magnetoovum sp. WYHC-5]